jgi:hypothetical protein
MTKRAEACYEKLMRRTPVITNAERAMERELSVTQNFLRDYSQQLSFVKRTLEDLEEKVCSAIDS